MALVKLTNERINELLKIVLEKFKKDEHNETRGICYFIDSLNFNHSYYEVIDLYKWFQNQRPKPNMHYQFYKDKEFYDGHWWWVRTPEGKEKRIEFLEYLIEKTSN
jgi:hypothetical protein